MTSNSNVRNIFSSVSEKVFPGSGSLLDGNRAGYLETGNLLISNLGLQMALYFNCHFSPLWLITSLVMLGLKYDHLSTYYRFVLIVVFIVMASLELLRLYLGYSGNLQEKVPELAGFWLVTFILQLPLICFVLFNEHTLILPLERAVHMVMLTFLLFEVVQGYRAIKVMTDAQVQKFHMKHFSDSTPHVDDDGAIELKKLN